MNRTRTGSIIQMILCGVMGLLFLRPGLLATTHYVSPVGNDANAGSLQSPWKTLSKANRTLKAGDTLYIRDGIYAEDINPVNSGTPSAPILIQNYNNEEVIVKGPASGEEIAVVALGYPGSATGWGASSYITLEGLTIDPAYARYGIVIYGDNSQYNLIRHCRLINSIGGKRDGILIGSAKHTIVENCTIDGNWRLGIITTQTPLYTIIRGNTIQNMVNSGIDIQTSYGVNQSFLIENNLIAGSQIEDGIQFEPDYSKYDPGTKRGVIIRNNTLCQNAENAIDLKGCAFVVIEGNIIWGNRGDNDGSGNISGGIGGVFKGDITFTQAHDILVRKNVIYDNFGGVYITNYGWTVVHNTILGNNKTYWGSDVSEQEILNAANEDARRSPKLCGVILAEVTVSSLKNCAIKNNIIGLHHQGEVNVIMTRDLNGTDINGNLYYNEDAVNMVDLTENWNFKKVGLTEFKNKLSTLAGLLGKEAKSIVTVNPGLKMGNLIPSGAGPFNVALESNSPAIDKGDFLTRASSAGTGKTIRVKNTRYFTDGYGITDGDIIKIASNDQIAKIITVTDSVTLVLDRDVSWVNEDGVSLFYYGSAPDMGSNEYMPQYFPHEETGGTAVTLFADVISSITKKLGFKTLNIQLTTSEDVIQIPTPLIMTESDGSQTNIMMDGTLPGKSFSGSVTINETIAEGLAKFTLPDNSLVNAVQATGKDILNGGTIKIDKTPPTIPMSVKIVLVNS
jgi:parallel beta-helix repeat protein